VDGRDKPGHDDESELAFAPPNILFIIFVDAIFTSLLERPFTKVFDVTGANPGFSCVYRACHAD
jgi:hypothetical protein